MEVFTENQLNKTIRFWLQFLVTHVSDENLNGFHDANKSAEGFFCGLLNTIYPTYKLVQLEPNNYPAIDLGDTTSKLSVQITSEHSQTKVSDAIKKFEDHKLYEIYNHLQILMIVIQKNKKYMITTNGNYACDPDNDIFDINDLTKVIRILSAPQQEKILLFLTEKLTPLKKTYEPKTYSIETKMFQELFSLLAQNDKLDDRSDNYVVSKADLDLKKKRFGNFWDEIDKRYRNFINLQMEIRFAQVMNHFPETQRIKLHQKLMDISTEELEKNNNNPLKTIDELVKKIINDNDLAIYSEMDIKYFLYFHLYNCNVFPNLK